MRCIATLAVACAVPLTAQHAYLDKISAAPGETVQVFASIPGATSVSVARSHYFGLETQLLDSGPLAGGTQPASIGSYAYVADDPLLDITGDITLEAWVRPKFVSATSFAGILMKYASPSDTAYGIYLMPGGQLSFYLSETGAYSTANRHVTPDALSVNTWTHVVATYDGANKRIYLNGQLETTQPRTGAIFDSAQPLRVGAREAGGAHFYGDIDGATVYSRALTPAEVQARFALGASSPGVLAGAVAQYDCEEMVGDKLSDATGNGLDLTLVNHATRGIPGPSEPPCCSTPEPFTTSCCSMPTNWCIRFSGGDRYNPDWTPIWSFVVPPSWDPGFYSVEVAGAYTMPFVVKPTPGKEERIAVLANSNTWAAYNQWSYSLYSRHPGESINRYVGLRQPNPNAQLDLQTPGSGFSPRVDAERYLYKWLDDHGYEFDLYTDLDLHRDPTLLSSYSVLMISGHSEYWTWEMVDHLEAFLYAGGNLVNLSGNTMWSRVTYDPTFTVMESRKHPWNAFPLVLPPGERWHSQDGQVLGGTFRCIGRPEHRILGTGFGIVFRNGSFGSYAVAAAGHWAFAGTGVTHGQFFGQSSLNGNAILGHEVDEIHPTWSPANIQVLARGRAFNADFRLDVSNCNVRRFLPATEGGEMIYFDHPGGGAVFGAPTVAFGGAVMVDAVASQVLENVLNRFLGQPACVFRNGSGVNETGFGCATLPILGTNWKTTVATHGTTASTYLSLAVTPAQLLFPGGGELLLSPVPPPVFQAGNGTHSVAVPNNSVLLGAWLYAQGMRVDMVGGLPSLVLLNAQDVLLGQ